MECCSKLVAVLLSVLALALGPIAAFAANEPKWNQIHTAHFDVWTDAGDKRGREVALRMEQMRTLFGQLLMRSKLKMPFLPRPRTFRPVWKRFQKSSGEG